MSLRNQPYFPLYVQDFLTDEKLMECSPAATGVCIKVMCMMHKSQTYGKIELRDKDRVSDSPTHDLALRFSRSLPWSVEFIEAGLKELIEEGVMKMEDNFLIQKRMVKDNEKSLAKAKSGKKGAKKRWEESVPDPLKIPKGDLPESSPF